MKFPIVESCQATAAAVEDGNAIGVVMGGVDVGMQAINAFVDPINFVVGQLLDEILQWILDNLPPFREALKILVGDSGAVFAWADTWRADAQKLAALADQVVANAAALIEGWESEAKRTFAVGVALLAQTMRGLAKLYQMCAAVVEGIAQVLVVLKELICGIIKDFVIDLVTKAIMAAAAAVPSLGAAIAAYMTWASAKYAIVAGKVARNLQKLFEAVAGKCKQGSALQKIFTTIAGHFQKIADNSDNLVQAQRVNEQQQLADQEQAAADAHTDRAEAADRNAAEAYERARQNEFDGGDPDDTAQARAEANRSAQEAASERAQAAEAQQRSNAAEVEADRIQEERRIQARDEARAHSTAAGEANARAESLERAAGNRTDSDAEAWRAEAARLRAEARHHTEEYTRIVQGVNPGDTGQPWWQPSDGNIAQSVARGEQSDEKHRQGKD